MHDYYRRYIQRMSGRLARHERLSARLGWTRLAIVIVGGAATWSAFSWAGQSEGLIAAAVTLAVFYVAARLHRRVDASRKRHRLWQERKKEALARLQRDWDELPAPSAERSPSKAAPPPDEAHPFAPGLNITGPRSLLRLLDTCVTEGGSRRLRAWLLDAAPDRDRSLRRQDLVRELVPLSTFRDRLALEGRLAAQDPSAESDDTPRWSDRALQRWLDDDDAQESKKARPLRPWILGLGALGLLNIALALGHLFGALPPFWAATLPLYLLLYTFQLPAVKDLFDEAEALSTAFRRLRAAFRFLEEQPVAGRPNLRGLLAPIRSGDERRPSRHLRRAGRIAAAASTQRSELLALVNLLIPWDLAVASLLRRERARLRADLPGWLDVWYRLEALSALAAFKHRRPARAFPDLAAPSQRPVFEGRGLGHPLLPEGEKVRNDFCLEAPGAVALITGSNMAGKSTFLRTLGVNLCLAFAGGPVDARSLRTVPLRLFTCIDVSDSVTGGLSYFYAEVRRLKALMQALNAGDAENDAAPLFYLIDEIFRGTNNRERLIGSRAYLKALAEKHGLGAVATHDLELTELSGEIEALENYHFREDVEEPTGDGEARMTFDYTLRRGPCPTTNALKIMRAAGLPTDGFEETASEESAAVRVDG